MPPLKVPGVSRCLITSLLGNLYTIIYILFYSCIYNSQISIYRQITNGCFGDSHLLPTLQMDANECRLMFDFQRLSRTAFLHFSVPLSSERQLNCWVTWFVLQIGCCILAWDLCVNFIPNSEGSLALFLSVVCPTLFCN
jgi:hypothetical protein